MEPLPETGSLPQIIGRVDSTVDLEPGTGAVLPGKAAAGVPSDSPETGEEQPES
jgi:hypothetical protein